MGLRAAILRRRLARTPVPDPPVAHVVVRAVPAPRPGEAAEIRSWALASGMAVSQRGRLPAQVVEAYRAAHPV